ncbi:SMC-Scp complex subunit ScpB [Candidatus Woesearchaeota archaeon]|nr:SMC-Scp complex subunit ScpB [Candidatus Woesearchaeota archaeon]
MDEELKKRVESVLFSVGRRIHVDEIARLAKCRDAAEARAALELLKAEYDLRNSSLIISQDGDEWKLTVRDTYLPLVRKIVSRTELPKGVTETLAVIAYKAPFMQSALVKIRTNKAYDHLAQLEERGYITREKKGRTKLIRLANKFFDYFDIPQERVREAFRTVAELEHAISSKEKELSQREERAQELAQHIKADEESHKQSVTHEHERLDKALGKLPEVSLTDQEGKSFRLSVYQVVEKPEIEVTTTPLPELETVKDVLDGLEIYESPETKPAKPERVAAVAPVQQSEVMPESEQATAGHELAPEDALQPGLPEQEISRGEPSDSLTPESLPQEPEIEMPEPPAELPKSRKRKKKEPEKFEGPGMFSEGVPAAVAQRIDQRVAELLGTTQAPETNAPAEQSGQEPTHEGEPESDLLKEE